MIRFHCICCGKRLKAPPELSGKKGRCGCGESIIIPNRDDFENAPSNDCASQPNSSEEDGSRIMVQAGLGLLLFTVGIVFVLVGLAFEHVAIPGTYSIGMALLVGSSLWGIKLAYRFARTVRATVPYEDFCQAFRRARRSIAVVVTLVPALSIGVSFFLGIELDASAVHLSSSSNSGPWLIQHLEHRNDVLAKCAKLEP